VDLLNFLKNVTGNRSKFLARAWWSNNARAGILSARPTLGEMTMTAKITPRGYVDVHSRDGSIKNRSCPYFNYDIDGKKEVWFAWWDDQDKKTGRPDRIICMHYLIKSEGPSETVDRTVIVEADVLRGKRTSFQPFTIPEPDMEFD
jgi:hypothetical protein